jgi:hypothetical protein
MAVNREMAKNMLSCGLEPSRKTLLSFQEAVLPLGSGVMARAWRSFVL